MPGRFRLGKVIPLPPVTSRCFRWLPRQQHAYAAMLATVAASTGQSHVSRAYVVGQLAHLPAVGADAFERYLRSTDVPTCEAALAALSRTDRPAAALPRLLDFLDGDRARVAMYAVPRVARFLAPSALEASLAPLARASERKVTVRKEALRLLGMHRTPGALAVLDALAADATTHPDVVAAVVHAARSLADRAEARALLGRLAASPHASVAQALLAGSIDSLAPEARGEYARIVLALLEHDDPRTRRLAVNTLLPFTAGVEPQAVAALSRVIQRLDRLESWADAVRVTVALATRQDLADGVADALHELVVGLVAASDAEHAAGAAWPTDARDRPATPRLSQLMGALAAADLRRRRAVVRLYDRLAAALASPGWHPARAALALAAVDLHHPDRAAPRLAALADDPSLAPYAETLSRILEGVREVEIDAVALVDALAARGSLGARLALALVRAVGGRHAGPEPAVAALSRLRQSPDEPTAYAARRTFVRREVPTA
ncbi:MAG: hypothetical protein U1F43_33995 [Myxococcota bacterium]